MVMQPLMEEVQFLDTVIGKPMPLELCPDVLVRVKLRRIWRKPFHRQPLVECQESLRFLRPMNISTIPDDDDVSANLSQELPKKADQLRRFHVSVCIQSDVQAKAASGWRNGDAGDGRNLSAVPSRVAEYRGRSTESPGAPDERKHREASLVENNTRRFLPIGFFLSGANLALPSAQSPFRPFRKRVAEAFARSSQGLEESSRRGLGDISRRKTSESIDPHAGRSIDRWGIHGLWDLSKEHAPTFAFAAASTWAAALDAVCFEATSLLSCEICSPNPERYGVTPKMLAISVGPFPCFDNFAASIRRASSSLAVPCGLIPH